MRQAIDNALESGLYLPYVWIIGGSLLLAGALLATLRWGFGKNVGGVWRTYRSWLVMAPLVMVSILLGRTVLIGALTILAVLGFKEFARATGVYRDWTVTGAVYLGIVAVAATCLVIDPELGTQGWYGLFMALPAYTVALLLAIPTLRNRAQGQLQVIALAIVGFLYLGWMFGHLSFLASSPRALGYLLYIFFAVELNDVSAFCFGKLFGRRKLATEISPNKTLEGSLGALAVSMVLPWALRFSFPHFEPIHLVLTGLIVGIGGQLGDLSISWIKRDLGVKDMGTILPGHGGILDRIDSLIYVAPLYFHMIRWFHGLA